MPDSALDPRDRAHWFALGLGKPPYAVRCCVAYPDDSIRQRSEWNYQAMLRAGEKIAGDGFGTCRLCGQRCGWNYVIYSIDDIRFPACEDCIRATGSSDLIRKVCHIKHERDRMYARLTSRPMKGKR